MLIFFPLIALIVIAYLYRDDLGPRALVAYGIVWTVCLAITLAADFSPGVFVVLQCLLAIAMLIHVGANPDIPLR